MSRAPDPNGKVIAFNEWVAALIEFATNDGDMRAGRKSQQTKDAAKWLRAAYRDALNAATKEE